MRIIVRKANVSKTDTELAMYWIRCARRWETDAKRYVEKGYSTTAALATSYADNYWRDAAVKLGFTNVNDMKRWYAKKGIRLN